MNIRNSAKSKVSIALIDDHEIVRSGLKMLLEQSDFDVVGEADDGRSAIDMLGRVKPDVALVDVSMPLKNGFEVVESVRKQHLPTRMIVLSIHDGPEYAIKAFKAGACGYLNKAVDSATLLSAIKSVVANGTCFSPPMLSSGPAAPMHSVVELTAREKEIVRWVVDGRTNKEIGKLLDISTRTVEVHRLHVMRKLNVSNAAELVKVALMHKLVDVAD
jgi:DNA-binding NarL/FixJ family response regulator